jgi:tRNA threonylcarbamoyladenosine biosynthesis protein TsaB
MPTLLALDTSTEACSVALLRDGAISERYIEAPREHMLRLLPMVDELLSGEQLELRDLDGIVFTRGPGSFTGLRITLGVVQGLAFGANLPVLPVSTLAVLAQSVATVQLAGRFILSAIDARMDEVYCAWFEVGGDGLVRACGEERVCPPEAVTPMATNEPWLGVGSGWNYAARLPATGRGDIVATALPRAAAALQLALPRWQAGERHAIEQVAPVYLRDDVAWPKGGTQKNDTRKSDQ